MKRKLIKRNKQFLSDRYKHSLAKYGKSCKGNIAFQVTIETPVYITKRDDIRIGAKRYTWEWWWKQSVLDEIFKLDEVWN